MAISKRQKRTFAAFVGSLFVMTAFQNCGQPGSIAIDVPEKINSVPGEDNTTAPIPVPDAPVGSYKDYEKSVTVSASSSKVDVIVVVDNSGSMSNEQANMGARFGSFLSRLANLDWQVGIVTTDPGTNEENAHLKDGRLLKYNRMKSYLIKSSDNLDNAKLAFSETVQRPIGEGSGLEQGVRTTYRALERALNASDATNKGLVREGAALSVIVVTDADETVESNEKAGDVSTFADRNKPEKLIAMIAAKFPDKKFKFNSIIVRDGDEACLRKDGAGNEGYGKNYQKLTNLTSGILGSVCEADYGNQLSIIGDSTTEMVKTVTLDCSPVDSDKDNVLDLTITNQVGTKLTAYTVSGRIVTFAQNLPVGTIKVAYRCQN